jgi:hypothetical protein
MESSTTTIDNIPKVKVFLQYRTLNDQKQWCWFPVNPNQSQDALAFDLLPGQEVAVHDDGWRVNASRVRIWAQSDSGTEWQDYKGRDLWLVTRNTADGTARYFAPEMETYTFTFER